MTTAKSFAPSLRNVFTITCASESGDKCVRYGDKIRIETEVGGKKVIIFIKFSFICRALWPPL